jgi:glycosyltransferase 2 family protein
MTADPQEPERPDAVSSPGKRIGRSWHRWLTIPVGVLALAGTVWTVGAGALWERLRALDARWLGLALAITGLQFLLMAWRWWFIARQMQVPLRYVRALGEYYLSVLLNFVLPVGVVGDALRAFRHADHAAPVEFKRPVAATVVAMLLDRASSQLSLLLVILAGAPGWSRVLAPVGPDFGLRPALGTAALIVGLLVVGALGRHHLRRLARVAAAGLRVFLAWRNLTVHLGLSVLVVMTHVGVFLTSARALGVDLTVQESVGIAPLVLAATSLLSFFGGFGTREVAAAALFHLSGRDVAAGAAVAFVFGAISMLGSLPGLLALPWKTGSPDHA